MEHLLEEANKLKNTDIYIHDKFALGLVSWTKTLKWLDNLSKCNLEIKKIYFEECCSEGYLEMAKWLYNFGLDISKFSYVTIYKNENLEMVQWLQSIGLNIDYDNMFQNCCRCGHLEVAKWLYEDGKILNSLVCVGFTTCCLNGHLEMAQWLYGFGIDPFSVSYGFKTACQLKHFEIVKWLHSVNSKLVIKLLKNINTNVLKHLDISPQSIFLLKRIVYNEPFPDIEDVDNIVLYGLGHHNMISHLKKLRNQFGFFDFEIINAKVANLTINRVQTKSARNIV